MNYSDTGLYDFAVIILDAPVPNLCVAYESPRALPLPFDVKTDKVTVTVDSLLNGVTECRHYGYGQPDSSYFQLAFSIHEQMLNIGGGIRNAIKQKMSSNASLCNVSTKVQK